MKKFWSIICAVAIIALALCVFAACGGVKEVNIDRLLKKCDVHKEASLSEPGNATDTGLYIRVDSDVYNVYLHEIEYGNNITLDYIDNSQYPVTLTVVGETQMDGEMAAEVHITEKANRNAGANKNNFLIVGVPESLMGNVQLGHSLYIGIVTDTGNVQIEDIEHAESISATTETGTVYIGDCHANNLVVSVDTGAVYVEAEGETARISTDTGAVEFDLTAKNITVTTGTGSVRGTLEHPEYWYTIDAHSDTGSCNLNNRTGSGDYKLTVKTGTGSIYVIFDND